MTTTERPQRDTRLPALAAERRTDVAPPQSPRLISSADCSPALVTAYQTLRTNVAFSLLGAESRVIMGASLELAQDRTAEVMVNLALTLAESGDDVLVVDCNLHKPSLHTLLDIPNDRGLAQLLAGQWADSDAVARGVVVPNLRMITSGASVDETPLRSAVITTLVESVGRLRPMADIVLLIAPPLLSHIETLHLSAASDGLIAVVSTPTTQRQSLRRARHLLARVNAPLLGAVVLSDAG